MNNVSLIGNITRDIELKYTTGSNPIAVARFTVAVRRRYKKEGSPDADFINTIAFGKTAEFVSKYFEKGQSIAIVGSIQTGSYEKDGRTVYTTDVIASDVGFTGASKPKQTAGDIGDLPF